MNNFVAMAEHICPICNKTHTNNTEILISKRLRSIPEDKRVTGISFCEEHQKLSDDGFVCIIGVDESKSEASSKGTLKPEGAYRTGEILHVRKTVLDSVAIKPVDTSNGYVFGGSDLIKWFVDLAAENTNE